jgi:DegV family protein with EDD domain
MKVRICFVTDSTSDIPAQLAEEHAIEVVPAIINVNGESYEDGKGISREEFYTLLPKLNVLPTTAAPSVGSFQERYERLLCEGATNVLSVHPPDTLSGIFNSARLAATEFGNRVHVLDSGQVSLGLGFQVLMAAEGVRRGALLEETLALIQGIRQRIHLAAVLDTIEYVRRSGRVSWARAMIGSVLRVHPLISLQSGIVERLGQVRTRAQGLLRLTEMLDSWEPLDRLAVLHTNAEASAKQLFEEWKARVPVPPLLVNVTTVVGTHVGPNAVGLVGVSVL